MHTDERKILALITFFGMWEVLYHKLIKSSTYDSDLANNILFIFS